MDGGGNLCLGGILGLNCTLCLSGGILCLSGGILCLHVPRLGAGVHAEAGHGMCNLAEFVQSVPRGAAEGIGCAEPAVGGEERDGERLERRARQPRRRLRRCRSRLAVCGGGEAGHRACDVGQTLGRAGGGGEAAEERLGRGVSLVAPRALQHPRRHLEQPGGVPFRPRTTEQPAQPVCQQVKQHGPLAGVGGADGGVVGAEGAHERAEALGQAEHQARVGLQQGAQGRVRCIGEAEAARAGGCAAAVGSVGGRRGIAEASPAAERPPALGASSRLQLFSYCVGEERLEPLAAVDVDVQQKRQRERTAAGAEAEQKKVD
mmetsp:Transcript_20725/g.67054  ORF Transcript_20725/g.67054 Transcript_20725/m.67054 type:complete len:319 (+) Transcript_20725:1996-2952(+)